MSRKSRKGGPIRVRRVAEAIARRDLSFVMREIGKACLKDMGFDTAEQFREWIYRPSLPLLNSGRRGHWGRALVEPHSLPPR